MVVDVEMRTWEGRNGRVVVTFSVLAFAQPGQNNLKQPKRSRSPRRILFYQINYNCGRQKRTGVAGFEWEIKRRGTKRAAICLIASLREGEKRMDRKSFDRRKRGNFKGKYKVGPPSTVEGGSSRGSNEKLKPQPMQAKPPNNFNISGNIRLISPCAQVPSMRLRGPCSFRPRG